MNSLHSLPLSNVHLLLLACFCSIRVSKCKTILSFVLLLFRLFTYGTSFLNNVASECFSFSPYFRFKQHRKVAKCLGSEECSPWAVQPKGHAVPVCSRKVAIFLDCLNFTVTFTRNFGWSLTGASRCVQNRQCLTACKVSERCAHFPWMLLAPVSKYTRPTVHQLPEWKASQLPAIRLEGKTAN